MTDPTHAPTKTIEEWLTRVESAVMPIPSWIPAAYKPEEVKPGLSLEPPAARPAVSIAPPPPPSVRPLLSVMNTVNADRGSV